MFCRLATSGDGALWGLSHKFGCSPADAVRILETARELGISEDAAKKRHVRALKRLKVILTGPAGDPGEFGP